MLQPTRHSSDRHRADKRRRSLPPGRSGGLEGLCGAAAGSDRLRPLSGAPGLERLEAVLHGQAYAPHRHDTYAIGVTLGGVQSFRFRGRQWHGLPGQVHVLHPDELHDGGAGTPDGFRYRILYLDPALLQSALSRRALPFVAEPLLAAERLPPGLAAALWREDLEPGALGQAELVAAAAELLLAAAGEGTSQRLALEGLARVRERLVADPATAPAMAELEALSGLDRWSLARQFRAAYGTSPSRFRLLRRLDQVRRRLRAGTPPAEAACAAGFADQAHMTRQFKRAYGLTPARWVALGR